jgi:hypothetical protein
MRKHLDRTNDAETKIKYFVEVDRREEKGEIKTIKFQKRQAALEFAERQKARNLKVRVLNALRKEIYSST